MGFDPATALVLYMCLLFSLCVHEAAHAAMSNYCGDDTARHLGRLTLNPIAHIDLLGTVILPLIMFFTNVPFLIGWAKPVPFNPARLNNPHRDPVLIAIAGPLSNLLLAILFACVGHLVLSVLGQGVPDLLLLFLIYIVVINLALMFFNFMPFPPLDGHYVLKYFLPPQGRQMLEQIGPFGILFAILLARPLFSVVSPVISAFQNFIVGG